MKYFSPFRNGLIKNTFRANSNPLGFAFIVIGLTLPGCASIKNVLNQGDKQPVEAARPVAAEDAQRDFAKAAQAMEQQNHELALQLLRSIQGRYPHLSGPWLNEGIILARLNQCNHAIVVLQKAIQLNPESQHSYNQLGLCYRETGQFTEAKRAYQKALDIDPNYQIAIYNLAILEELYLQDLNSALMHFRKYQSLQTEPEKRVRGWIKDLERRIPKQPAPELAEPTPPQEPSTPKDSQPQSQNKAQPPTQANTKPKQVAPPPKTQGTSAAPSTPAAKKEPAPAPKSTNTENKNSVFNDDFTLEPEETPELKQDKPARSSIWR